MKGKARFVLNTALTYGLTVYGLNDVYDRLVYGIPGPISMGRLIGYLATGIFAGFIAWSSMEDRYQKALNEARVLASTGGELPPQPPLPLQ